MTRIEEIEAIIADYHAGTVPQERMAEWVMQLVPDLLAENKRLREAVSRQARVAELSAEIMLDPKRTGPWPGADRTAQAFQRIALSLRAALTPEKVKP